MAVGTDERRELARAVRRNTVLLSASMAVLSAAQQLVAAIATLTFVLVTGIEGLLGLGPAIFLVTAALTALPAGRAMDRFGRVPVLATGFALGILGGLSTALGAWVDLAPAVILGFVLVGAASGTVVLGRAAAGDMYPPERRARGIAFVLSGAVFGAILGPAVFSPLVAGSGLDAAALAVPWLAGAGFMAAGLALVLAIRPDPKALAERVNPSHDAEGGGPVPAAPLTTILGRRGVIAALLAALASFGVMVSVMNLIGFAVVNEHGHHQKDVFPIIGAHVLGMYALVLVVGSVIDRLGTTTALAGGLALMGASCAGLVWGESVLATAALLFGLGLGWNLSFVAATAALIAAAGPAERGKLLGFNDLLSSLLAASLALLGGYALQALGVIALAVGAAALVLGPAAYIAARGVRAARPALAVPGERQ
jgi:MFS family permease